MLHRIHPYANSCRSCDLRRARAAAKLARFLERELDYRECGSFNLSLETRVKRRRDLIALESVVRYPCSRRRHAIKPRPHVDIAWRLPPRLPSNYHGTRYASLKQTGVTLPPRSVRGGRSRFSAPAQNSRRVSKLPRDDDTSGDKASRSETSGIARAPGMQMETAHRRRAYPGCCGIPPAHTTKWRLMEIELCSNRQYIP